MLQKTVEEIVFLLEQQFGNELYPAFDPDFKVESPVSKHLDTTWVKTAKTVGINVRTIQNFWNIIPYTLTLPAAQNAIHILPIWEPGVVASLYGPSSWNINPEFFSRDLETAFPHLNTVEKQLKVVLNLLHLLGKAVGMDVVPHTDRYAEMVIANPSCFEWLKRDDLRIVLHENYILSEVRANVWNCLKQMGSASTEITIPLHEHVFFDEISEFDRLRILFGEASDYWGRLNRRKTFVQYLYELGYETVPATMGPPYRGIEVDPNPDAKVIDEEGRIWRDYRITKPEKFSRVFGPLARYKLYESKDDNRNWELDFSKPNIPAWEYVCKHYRDIQAEFNFDFMRGDMSHVQMRPDGVPAQPDAWYDLLGAVKQTVLKEKPYFGYFAESFLAPPGEMAYGNELEHLEASFADSTLGDLQSEPLGTQKFVQDFAQYRAWLEAGHCAPNFTIMTADKDDPRFDAFYLKGNELRYFIALFLTDMPSYMGLGFECRDPHPVPAPNEHYTKLYVFQVKEGPKMTNGPFHWGANTTLYARLSRQKQLAQAIMPQIENAPIRWLIAPDPSGQQKVIAWTQRENPTYIFIANLDTENSISNITFELPDHNAWEIRFSTHHETAPAGRFEGQVICALEPGEGLMLGR
ncbi:MAG: hypothetical protein WCR52_04300 [Bacteroidota bacterium]